MSYLKCLADTMESIDFLKNQREDILALLRKDEKKEIIISVIGQFKRGKSSLINAVLGFSLLPCGIIPLTAAATEIRKGNELGAFVLFNDGREEEIPLKNLSEYAAEEKNPKNIKNVDKIKITCPQNVFGEGVVLVDTPGVGSINTHNTLCSEEYVKISDAVIFLLSPDSPVSETEKDFLIKTKAFASKFFFAVNKADTVSPSDLEVFITYAQNVLSDIMEKEISLLPLSAKENTGIEELKNLISSSIKTEGSEILASSINKKAEIIVASALAKLRLAADAARLPSEELKEKLNRLNEKRASLSYFSEEVNVLSSHRTRLLVEKIDEGLNKEKTSIRERLNKKGQELYNEFISLDQKEFQKKAEDSINSHMKAELENLNSIGYALLEKGYEDIANALNQKAADTKRFISNILEEEFGLSYPVEKAEFKVTDKSDFILHLGLRGTLLIDRDFFMRFMGSKKANELFLKKCIDKASEDLDFNKNNMVSNYRYKMQESLREMCSLLTSDIKKMDEELASLISSLSQNLTSQEEKKEQMAKELNNVILSLQNALPH